LTETYATSEFPAGRYGRRRAPRRGPAWARKALVAALTGGVLVAGGAGAYLLGQRYGDGRPYEATVERFHGITESQVVVEFRVVVPDGEAAWCAVRARGADGAEVGREDVRVDPPPGESRPLVVHTLATTARPVTGEVQRCWRAEDAGD
jgi:hypothetical protein